VVRPCSHAPRVNGDEVRGTSFMLRGGGYNVSEVDDLLGRVAAELDAGRPARPLIESAKFRRSILVKGGYDVDAVDWFLDQLLLRAGDFEQDGFSSDPWHHLAVTTVTYAAEFGGGAGFDGATFTGDAKFAGATFRRSSRSRYQLNGSSHTFSARAGADDSGTPDRSGRWKSPGRVQTRGWPAECTCPPLEPQAGP
jgi:DivIVA domain-containing protein